MKTEKPFVKSLFMILMALSIPAFLAVEAVQANKYSRLENELSALEKNQSDAIESNKRLISELGLLASSSRIETIATEKLGMHQATSDEIVRVEMKNGE